jgi:hypothetical protein
MNENEDKFHPGDRVKYIGNETQELSGRTGTVRGFSYGGGMINWDDYRDRFAFGRNLKKITDAFEVTAQQLQDIAVNPYYNKRIAMLNAIINPMETVTFTFEVSADKVGATTADLTRRVTEIGGTVSQ